MKRVVVGIDSSTQSCKVLVLDAVTGAELRSAKVPHPDGTSIDPRIWADALRSAWKQADPGSAGTVIGVGLAAQQHGMVALDSEGEPVFDALLWNDTRSAPEAAAMVQDHGAAFWASEVGSVPVASFTLTKLAWLARHEPDAAARVNRVVLPHDYLNHVLTGHWFTDRSDASGTGYFHPEDGYHEAVLYEYFGRLPELPEVIEPGTSGGKLLASFGAGEPPVSAGAGDNAAAALGLGMEAGEIAVSIGTSGTVFASVPDRPTPDPTGAVAGFADATGGYLPLLAVINSARVMASTAELLGVELTEFDRLASAGDPLAGGLNLMPYFDGERTPNLPDATGSLTGISRASLTRENMARASVLAVMNSLADAAQALSEASVPAQRALLIGGGARSKSLRAVAPDLLGLEVDVLEAGEYVALGAARQAAWAATGELPAFERRVETRLSPSGDGWGAKSRELYATERTRLYGV